MENLLDLMFKEVDGLYEPHPALTHIESIRTIISRDPGKVHPVTNVLERRRARLELAYVYMMVRRDLLSGYTHEQKSDTIRMRLGLKETWKPDDVVQRAIKELSEDTKTKQDRLLESAHELADDFIDVMSAMRTNAKRFIEFLNRDFKTLTAEEVALRTQEITNAKNELLKFVEMFKNIDLVVRSLDTLTAERVAQAKIESKKMLSSLETKKDRYERRAEEDE